MKVHTYEHPPQDTKGNELELIRTMIRTWRTNTVAASTTRSGRALRGEGEEEEEVVMVVVVVVMMGVMMMIVMRGL